MRGVVVDDAGMEVEVLGRIAIDGAQEAHELLMTMAIHARGDDRAAGNVERGEQRRRAVSTWNHGSRFRLGPFSRAGRVGAIERLELALLVDRQNQRVVGRVQIEAHDIGDFLGEIQDRATA